MVYFRKALQVVSPKGEDFEVEESALKEILLDSRVADSKVVIVSIAGGRGTGRSFLLNVFMKYLQNYGKNDWMDVPNDPVNGFKWGISNKANTTGLLLWPEPFIIKVPPTNEEVCVLLMDSQGYPPTDIMDREYLKIFALSSKISSVQIYATEDLGMMNLLYFEAALKGCEGNQIQRFYFLIQDSYRQNLYQNGLEGGRKYMEDRMKIRKFCSPVFEEAIKYFTEKLKDKRCFMMPSPGRHVKTYNFKGNLSDNGIEADFKSNLKTFTELVLGPENVVVKEIGGKRVTGKMLFEHFKTYTEESNQVSHTRDVLQCPGIEQNIMAMAEASTVYKNEMNKVFGVGMQFQPYQSQKYMESHHHMSLELALQKLRDIRKSKRLYGEDSFYEKELRQKLMKLYDGYRKRNLEKNGMRPALITLVYGGICVFLFLLNFFFSHDDYLLEITNPIGFVVIFCFVAWIICILIGQQKQVERVRGILEWVPNRIIYCCEEGRQKTLEIKKRE